MAEITPQEPTKRPYDKKVVEYLSHITPMPPFLILHLLLFHNGKLLTIRKKSSAFAFRLPSYELPSDSGLFKTILDYINEVRDEWLNLSPGAFTLAQDPLREAIHKYPLETGDKMLPTMFVRIDTTPVKFKLPPMTNLRGFELDKYHFHWANRNDVMKAMGGIGATAGVVAMEEFDKPPSQEVIAAHQAWLKAGRDTYRKEKEETILAPRNVRDFLATLNPSIPPPPPVIFPIPGLGRSQPLELQTRVEESTPAPRTILTLEEKNRAVQRWLPSPPLLEEGQSDETGSAKIPGSLLPPPGLAPEPARALPEEGGGAAVDSSPARGGWAETRGKPKWRRPEDGELGLKYEGPSRSPGRGRGRGRGRSRGRGHRGLD